MNGATVNHAAEMAADTRRRIGADVRFAKRMLSVYLRALKFKVGLVRGGVRRSSGGGATHGVRKSKGATRSAGTGKTEALIMAAHGGGLAGDAYAQREGLLIDTNMLGHTAGDRIAQWALDAARCPRVARKNLFKHVSLSLPPGHRLSTTTWALAVNQFLKEIGAEGCQFAAYLHNNTKNQHAHVVFSRVTPYGALVTDSQSYWRWRAATRRVEAAMGLTVDQSKLVEAETTTSERALNARRRADRRHTRDGHINPAVIRSALVKSTSQEQFANQLRGAGIELKRVQKNGTMGGLLFRKLGVEEWLAGSSISREFSLPRVQVQIELNRQALQRRLHSQAIPSCQPVVEVPLQDRPRGG